MLSIIYLFSNLYILITFESRIWPPFTVTINRKYKLLKLYGHCLEGQKVAMMRNNPEVCFQVEEMRDMANWNSVITWGNFEEINDEMERRKALHIIIRSKK